MADVLFTTWSEKRDMEVGTLELVHKSWSTELQIRIVQWDIEYFGSDRSKVLLNWGELNIICPVYLIKDRYWDWCSWKSITVYVSNNVFGGVLYFFKELKLYTVIVQSLLLLCFVLVFRMGSQCWQLGNYQISYSKSILCDS